MTGLVTGCAVGTANWKVQSVPASGGDIVVSAGLMPAMAPLYEGQSVSDVPGYAAMTSPANFSASTGFIVGASVAFTAGVSAADMPLAEDALAGFTVTVTDSNGDTHVFDAGAVSVQYEVRVTQTLGNEALIDINPLVPDTEALSIVISGDTYAGTYATTAGAVRNGMVNLAPPAVNGAPEVGALLSADEGLWATPTGNLALTYQWQRGTVPIAGAMGQEYTADAADAGTDIRCVVTGDDGGGGTLVVASAAISIPGEQMGPLVTAAGPYFEQSAGTPASRTIDLGAAVSGKEFVAVVAWAETVPGTPAVGLNLTLDGAPMALVDQVKGTDSDNFISIYKADAALGGAQELTVANAGVNALRGLSMRTFTLEQHTNVAFVGGDQISYSSSVDLSLPVTEGAEIIGAARLGNSAPGDIGFTLTGVTETENSGPGFHFGRNIHFAATASVEEVRTMTVIPDADGTAAFVAALLMVT